MYINIAETKKDNYNHQLKEQQGSTFIVEIRKACCLVQVKHNKQARPFHHKNQASQGKARPSRAKRADNLFRQT